MLGVGASLSAWVGHQAPASAVLCSRARWASLEESNSLDAVIWSSGIGAGPFTNGTSDEHVGTNAHETITFYVQNIYYLLNRYVLRYEKTCIKSNTCDNINWKTWHFISRPLNGCLKRIIFYPPTKAEWYRFGVRPGVTNLLGLYLKDYYIFEHETWGVYRSHWAEVHCTRYITLYILILVFALCYFFIL